MGLFSKMKDILFEEEEVTEEIPKVTKKEEKKVAPRREVVEEKPISRQIQPESKPMPEVTVPKTPMKEPTPKSYEDISERELYRSDNTSPFLDFDEEEFNQNIVTVRSKKEEIKKPTTNVLEYEKKKRIEKRTEYGRTERIEIREVVERKKFKPSPIISPVYGILNEDYKIEDIKEKKDSFIDNLDIESVRKKAFEQPSMIKEEPKETYIEEEIETVKIEEPMEEKAQKVRTIDELLEDTSDVTIDIEDDKDKQPNEKSKKEYDEIDEELEELINHPKENKKEEKKEFEDDDTLENDLFDLIDSMYDSREDGEF